MGQRFRIEGAACFLLALGLLILPLKWLIAVCLAAGFHELCHYAAARLLGVTILSFSVGPGGCLLSTGPLTRRRELICAAAGPAGSLLLFFLIHHFPLLAICGLVQGVYNLLPIYPMDGGRILRCIAGEAISIRVERFFRAWILIAGAFLTFWLKLGPLPLIFALILMGKTGKTKNTLQTTPQKSTIDLPKIKR